MSENSTIWGLPQGFQAAGTAAGIKPGDRPDMAMIVCDNEAVVAGTFTRNQVTAAPVKLCRERLVTRRGRAVVINSGIANTCTGEAGMVAARRMAELTARQLGCDENQVYVCSTGSIGKPMPMDKIEPGIEQLASKLGADKGLEAADGILTTDTVRKVAMEDLIVDGRPVRVSGLAKGAGMIEPNMATMLAFVLTDAVVDAHALQKCLSKAVNDSFNRISVDGDCSTNDTVLLMAGGQAGNEPLTEDHPDWKAFAAAVNRVCFDLAMKMVQDGEGATKHVTIQLRGARSEGEAEYAVRAVANSLLVKTSWVERSANWGRIMDSLGYSRAEIDENLVDIDYNGIPAVRAGCGTDTPREQLEAVVAEPKFRIDIDLHLGEGEAVVYTCDCTEAYVRINV
jgi:glutamate N-acetyltransferase/amino-acid N-acetyltransferase